MGRNKFGGFSSIDPYEMEMMPEEDISACLFPC
jgi:hypothetical protein